MIEVFGAAEGEDPLEPPPLDGFSVAIEVDDADKRFREVLAAGCDDATPPEDRPWEPVTQLPKELQDEGPDRGTMSNDDNLSLTWDQTEQCRNSLQQSLRTFPLGRIRQHRAMPQEQ